MYQDQLILLEKYQKQLQPIESQFLEQTQIITCIKDYDLVFLTYW